MKIKMTVEEWQAEAKRRFGPDSKQWRFVCPSCGHVASAQEWMDAGASRGEIGFSCIGRRLGAGGDSTFKKEGGPCNYAGGGLFKLNPIAVTGPDDSEEKKPVTIEMFAFAEPPAGVNPPCP